MDKHVPSSEETKKLKVMADLRGSDCISVEECAAVFQYYEGWERRLVGKAAIKESFIVYKIASVMDKHLPSNGETRKLKVMADVPSSELRGSDCLSVGECGAVFQDHTEWERRLVEKAAVKKSDIVEKIASIMETKKLKGILKIDVLNLTMCIFAIGIPL
jgi:hypothetical protein